MGNKLEEVMPIVFGIAAMITVGFIVLCWNCHKMAEVGQNQEYVSSTEAARARRMARASAQPLSGDFTQEEMGDLEIGAKPMSKAQKLKKQVTNPMFRSSGDQKNQRVGNAPLQFKK